MPLSPKNTRTFHRKLYAGELETITLLKRNDDQQAGTVSAYVLYQCRHSIMHKTNEQIAGDETANHRCTWHIPRVELDRIGIDHLNSLDRIVDKRNMYWQGESTTEIRLKIWLNHYCIDCLRVDP